MRHGNDCDRRLPVPHSPLHCWFVRPSFGLFRMFRGKVTWAPEPSSDIKKLALTNSFIIQLLLTHPPLYTHLTHHKINYYGNASLVKSLQRNTHFPGITQATIANTRFHIVCDTKIPRTEGTSNQVTYKKLTNPLKINNSIMLVTSHVQRHSSEA